MRASFPQVSLCLQWCSGGSRCVSERRSNLLQAVHVGGGPRRCMSSLEWLCCLPVPSSAEAMFTIHV